jgi:hypothetical protein
MIFGFFGPSLQIAQAQAAPTTINPSLISSPNLNNNNSNPLLSSQGGSNNPFSPAVQAAQTLLNFHNSTPHPSP